MNLSRYFCCTASSSAPSFPEDTPSPVPTGVSFLLQLPLPRDLNQLLNYESSLRAYLEDTQSKHKGVRSAVRGAIQRQNSAQTKALIAKGKQLQEQEKALQDRLEQVLLLKAQWHVQASIVKNPLIV